MRPEKLSYLVCGLSIRVIIVFPFCPHNRHQVLTLLWWLHTIGIFLNQLTHSFSVPLGALAIETFCPGSFVVGTIGSLYPIFCSHVEYFTDPGGIITRILEKLRPRFSIRSDLVTTTHVVIGLSCTRIIAEHQRS